MLQLSKRGFDVVNSRQVVLLVIPPIFLALATIVVAVRWFARKTKRINTLVEDALCFCSLAMCLLVTILVYVLVLRDGQGMSTSFVREKLGSESGIKNWLRTQFTLDVCWALSVGVVQLFLLQFYTRLYRERRRLLYLCYTMMALVGLWMLYAITVWALHCRSADDCRLPTVRTCVIIGSIHILSNLIVMGMGVPAVYSMHFRSRKRLSVAGLLLLGTFCTLCGIFRMECCLTDVFGDYETDPIASSWGRMLFSPLEIAVGIIACTLPTLDTFRKYWVDEERCMNLRKMGQRADSAGSSHSELKLYPENYGRCDGKVTTYAAPGKADVSLKVIKVTKEYDIGPKQ